MVNKIALTNCSLRLIQNTIRSEFAALKFVDEFTVQGAADICQFIEFEMYKRNTNALTRATLEEIPEQMIAYFMERNIYPNSDFEEMETPFIEEADMIEGSVASSIRSTKKADIEKLNVYKNAFKVQVSLLNFSILILPYKDFFNTNLMRLLLMCCVM